MEPALARIARTHGSLKVWYREIRNSYFPANSDSIKTSSAEITAACLPELILTRRRGNQHDLHQYHRLVCEPTWNTFPNRLILDH